MFSFKQSVKISASTSATGGIIIVERTISEPFDIMMSAPLIVRTNDYIYAMGKYDFEHGDNIPFEGVLKEFHDLCYGQFVRKTALEGKTYIDKVNEYIANSISRY